MFSLKAYGYPIRELLHTILYNIPQGMILPISGLVVFTLKVRRPSHKSFKHGFDLFYGSG
jgi:hypothetical protein